MLAASRGVGARPWYSAARSLKLNSGSPQASHRKSVSISPAARSAWSRKSARPASAKRRSTLVAFTFERLPCGASTCSDASCSASTVPTLNSPFSSYRTFMAGGASGRTGYGVGLRAAIIAARRCPPRALARRGAGELEDQRQMLGKAAQRMVAAFDHDLPRTRVLPHRLAVVEHLVARLDEQQIALRVNGWHIEPAPLLEVRVRQLVFLAGIKVALDTEIALEISLRLHRRVDEHRPQVVLLDEIGRVETAERTADERHHTPRLQEFALDERDRVARPGRELRTGEPVTQPALGEVALKRLRLVRLRGAVEAVEIDDHAAALSRRARRAASLSWMPPKPPFDITSTWSPRRASRTTSATS